MQYKQNEGKKRTDSTLVIAAQEDIRSIFYDHCTPPPLDHPDLARIFPPQTPWDTVKNARIIDFSDPSLELVLGDLNYKRAGIHFVRYGIGKFLVLPVIGTKNSEVQNLLTYIPTTGELVLLAQGIPGPYCLPLYEISPHSHNQKEVVPVAGTLAHALDHLRATDSLVAWRLSFTRGPIE